MKRQAGFTLIELVMVIVILGILSAFALPRFADLGQEARAASIEGVAGAVRSAASIAHADFLVSGDADAAAGIQVSLEGTIINMINGYPEVAANTAAAGTADIILAAQVDTTDFTVAVTGGNVVTITAIGAADPAECLVTYNEANANASPVITVDTDNC